MTLAQPLAKKDASASRAWLRALEMTARIEDAPSRTFPVVVEELGARFGGAPALIGAQQTFSHAQLAARANRVARWALAEGIQKGDTVCLLLPNAPDYLALWLGLTRIGAVAALLNTNLRGEALGHCMRVANARHTIIADSMASAMDGMVMGAKLWWHGEAFCVLLDTFCGAPLDEDEKRDVTLNDRALLIYTSGTTGLPKAAPVSHRRVMNWTHWFAGMTGATAEDRLYNCLPMYHSVGGVVASGAVLVAGGAVILREKFSATRFWQDVADSGATMFQYIGELCRYLLTSDAPVPPHRLRLAVGNGLGGDVWDAFQGRFAIPRILEFYAATEGNFSLYNAEGQPGAIGRIPGFLAHRFPTAIVKFDAATGLPARGTDGLCIAVSRGETGEAIGKIAGGAARFEGYTDAAATEKKILRDVFAPGDAWVRSGDLMRQDAQGFFYFVDRIGDTFRWKGENVATTEVAAVAAGAPGVKAVNIYGVGVPGHSGKCGMAALEVEDGFDVAAFRGHVALRLPAYARPLFLRLVKSLALTETFKQKKHGLAQDGFNPYASGDALYADLGDGYVPLDAALYARISSGLMRL
ncbi:MAG TPA: long-chain-acyl-CoA synthetase [Rhizomicrobium sp.]|jgi:fatty-acyl-CoA synthase|nr:long-chain-acyl-CoA synthetase [Rhizomicrobium sp.]